MNSSFNFLFYWSYCRNTKKCHVPGDNIQQQNKQNITINSSLTSTEAVAGILDMSTPKSRTDGQKIIFKIKKFGCQ